MGAAIRIVGNLEAPSYQRTLHAAAHTGDYLFSQLIPYIGNKRKLLPLIAEALALTGLPPGRGVFADLFAGSGVVSRWAKRQGWRVLSNDWEPYARALNLCAIGCNAPPTLAALGGYEAALQGLNALPPRTDWVTEHLCPPDDAAPDPDRQRLFFLRSNGQRIDAIRQQIAQWRAQGVLASEAEEACLLAPLLYQACYVSNTSGVFKAFHRGWGGQTGTALYRILAPLRLAPAVFWDNGLPNEVFQEDAEALAQRLQKIDVVYLDPPYNQHPYGSNYHVLNSIALWDRPSVPPPTAPGGKSAIRLDWRTERRSAYNHRAEAAAAYRRLLGSLDARFILTSYSTDGTIPLEELLDANLERGSVRMAMRSYKRYRVSSQRYSHRPHTVEFVLVTDTLQGQPHPARRREELQEELRGCEQDLLRVVQASRP